jgi:hypothetical protein
MGPPLGLRDFEVEIFGKTTRIDVRRGRRIMVIPKLPKLEPWVRFPSPAPLFVAWRVPTLP